MSAFNISRRSSCFLDWFWSKDLRTWYIITYLLHDLTCAVPRVRGLHYTIVTSTSTLGMDRPTPCLSILNQRCIQTLNCETPCLPWAAPRVITSNDCLVHLPRPCVWVHTLNMTIPTKTPTSQVIFYRT